MARKTKTTKADDKPEDKPAAAAPQPAPKGPPKIIIKGDGTPIPIYADGEMRRVDTGKPVEVSEAEQAFIDYSGIEYTQS